MAARDGVGHPEPGRGPGRGRRPARDRRRGRSPCWPPATRPGSRVTTAGGRSGVCGASRAGLRRRGARHHRPVRHPRRRRRLAGGRRAARHLRRPVRGGAPGHPRPDRRALAAVDGPGHRRRLDRLPRRRPVLHPLREDRGHRHRPRRGAGRRPLDHAPAGSPARPPAPTSPSCSSAPRAPSASSPACGSGPTPSRRTWPRRPTASPPSRTASTPCAASCAGAPPRPCCGSTTTSSPTATTAPRAPTTCSCSTRASPAWSTPGWPSWPRSAPAPRRLDVGLVDHWLGKRNDVAALEALISPGLRGRHHGDHRPVGALPGIYAAATEAIRSVEGTLVASAHQSHSYTDGGCLYFTFAAQVEADRARRLLPGGLGRRHTGRPRPTAARSATTTASGSTGPGSCRTPSAPPSTCWRRPRPRSTRPASSTPASSACPRPSAPPGGRERRPPGRSTPVWPSRRALNGLVFVAPAAIVAQLLAEDSGEVTGVGRRPSSSPCRCSGSASPGGSCAASSPARPSPPAPSPGVICCGHPPGRRHRHLAAAGPGPDPAAVGRHRPARRPRRLGRRPARPRRARPVVVPIPGGHPMTSGPDQILVVDVGTSSLRAAVVDRSAHVTHAHHRALLPDSPAPGLVEFDGEVMAATVLEVARAALAEARARRRRRHHQPAGLHPPVGPGHRRARSPPASGGRTSAPSAPAWSSPPRASGSRRTCRPPRPHHLLGPGRPRPRPRPVHRHRRLLARLDAVRGRPPRHRHTNAALTGLRDADCSDWSDDVLDRLRLPATPCRRWSTPRAWSARPPPSTAPRPSPASPATSRRASSARAASPRARPRPPSAPAACSTSCVGPDRPAFADPWPVRRLPDRHLAPRRRGRPGAWRRPCSPPAPASSGCATTSG